MKRTILPVLLLAGGIASMIYGAMFHSVPVVQQVVEEVVEKREVEETITIPHPYAPPPELAHDPSMFPPLPPITETVTRIVTETRNVLKDVTKDQPEPGLIWELTVGGVELLPTGELKRTYGPSLDGETPAERPSECPT